MAKFILSTDACIDLIDDPDAYPKLGVLYHGDLIMTAMTAAEFALAGERSSHPEQNRVALENLRKEVVVIDLDTELLTQIARQFSKASILPFSRYSDLAAAALAISDRWEVAPTLLCRQPEPWMAKFPQLRLMHRRHFTNWRASDPAPADRPTTRNADVKDHSAGPQLKPLAERSWYKDL